MRAPPRRCIGITPIMRGAAEAPLSARSAFGRGSSNCRFHDRLIASSALPADAVPSAFWPVGGDCSLVHSREGGGRWPRAIIAGTSPLAETRGHAALCRALGE
jgi:hypothetical protein